MYQIYHNPRCGKSREMLKILHERGDNVIIVEYLKNCPSFDQIKDILNKLGIPAIDLIRKNETIFKENYEGKNLSENDWIKAMVDHPILIERPIVIKQNKAIIGRPAENIEQLQ